MTDPQASAATARRPASDRLVPILAVLGCLPALVVLLLLRFKDGSLLVFGQAIAEYDLGRLIAVLQSILEPLYLLVPIAVVIAARASGARAWLSTAACPWLLLTPSVLAGMLVGGRGLGLVLPAIGLLSLFLLAMQLWLACLVRLLRPAPALLVYAAIWACSEYFDHLRLYVLPYLEIKALAVLGWLTWLLPQIKSGPSLVDDYLLSHQFDLMGPLPTLLQIPLLILAFRLLDKRAASRSNPLKAV